MNCNMNAAAAVAHNSVGDSSETRIPLKKRSNNDNESPFQTRWMAFSTLFCYKINIFNRKSGFPNGKSGFFH